MVPHWISGPNRAQIDSVHEIRIESCSAYKLGPIPPVEPKKQYRWATFTYSAGLVYILGLCISEIIDLDDECVATIP